jgi:hypothetical protein
MPIDFPTNPTTGLTYSYGGQLWEYNGVGWNKLIIADNANALYGISGSIYASSLATGLLYGGIISINAGNSAYFDITAGKGQIHASGSTYTADPQPTLQYVTWPAQTGITLTYLATNDTTWIYVDGAGTVQQRTEYYTDTQLETTIIIGQLVHPSRTFINLARTNPNVAYATDKQYEQFIRSFGPIKVSGHTIQPNGANLKLNRTSGTAFSLGRNWINDTDNPSVVSDGAYTDCIFFRYYRGATAGTFITVPNQTVIDPTKYDDGSGTLQTVPGGKYTIQRLFYYPNTPSLLGVYYGRAEYTSLADAAANINFENFTEIENTRTNAIFAGYLLVKSGATDLTNTSDALILQAGSFRSTTSGGGSVSLTLDDLTDVIITSPQNDQVLTYVDGVTGWENRSVSTLPLVSSFNGLTGAVVGVSSVRGLTGAVGITNGSGIGLSVSGQTMTFSNTGVLSIDGGTGAITNVARTNVANVFTESQTIGVTSSGLALILRDLGNSNEIYFTPGTKRITAYDDIFGNLQTLQFDTTANNTVTLPSINTTLAGLASVQTFTDTNTFNVETRFPGGISGAGATFSSLVRFNAGISSAGGTFSALTRFTAGISAAGGTFSGTQIFVNGATFQGNINAPNIVTSFNGLTGAVTGVTTGTANNFVALQSFSSGISAAGGITFANDISVNNLTIGQGPVSENGNIAIGEFVLAALQTGGSNTVVGSYALSSATAGDGNVAIGAASMANTTNAGNNNVAIGASALDFNDGGSDNIAIGNYALYDNKSGGFNVVIGHDALDGNQTGNRNIAIGYSSLGAGGNTANSDNVAIGSSALLTFNSGTQNTAIGNFAGRRRGTGAASLLSATGGIYIGYDARASADAQTNEIVIGNLAVGLGSNTAVIGRNTQTSATIYGLVNAPSGISAAGATLSANTIIPSGSTLTVNGNFVANGNVNLGDATTDSITVAGLLTANAGVSAAGGTFSALTRFTAGISASGGMTLAGSFQGSTATFSGLGSFNAGISSAGGTFSAQARFLSGITVAGGATFATDISVNSIRVGRGAGNQLYNVALGNNALTLNTSGNYNLAIGADALASNLTGTDNVGLGYAALFTNTSSNNLGIGSSSLTTNSSGSDNVGVGTSSLANNSTGSRNVGIGRNALSLNGNDNVAIGGYALSNISAATVRNQNTAIGSDAGRYRTGGSSLQGATGGIYIGYGARASANAQTNEIVIGTLAEALGSNTAVIGATTQTAATIYGLLNTPGGISSAGGTFSALTRFTAGISASGGTFSGTQTFVNGATFSQGINITGNVTSTGALIGYQQINTQTGTTYTAVLSDVSKLITLNNASGITMTIPLNSSVAFPTGTVLYFAQLGTGQVGFTGTSGVTLNFTPGRFTRTQYSTASAIQLSTNIWLLSGDLTA